MVWTITQSFNDWTQLQKIEKSGANRLKEINIDPSFWPVFSVSELAEYSARQRLWIAKDKNTALGFAAADVFERTAHLEEIDVDPYHSRLGIGKSLLTHVIEWAKDHHFAGITLRTFSSTPWSMGLYKKFGFAVTDSQPEYLKRIIEKEILDGFPKTGRVTLILNL